jgi:hypothetical protein
MALGFAPLLRVRNVFTQLEAQCPPVVRPLLAYFRTQWLTTVRPFMWNVFNTEHNMRTNNHLEGWHAGFSKSVNQHHPNIWRFICALQKEQATTEVTIQQIAAGQVIVINIVVVAIVTVITILIL